MADKLAYEELKQKVKELEKEAVERKCGEEKAEHLTAVLRAIRNVNQLIVREKHPGRLVEGVCDTLIETRGYYNAWVALLDESGVVMTTAEAGLGKLFLPMVELLKRGTLTDCGRRALKQSGVVVVEDPFSACSDCPLAGKYGDRGAMTIRLEYSGKVRGLLAVSTPRDRATEAEEQGLLEEVARDIAFALHSLELEEDRRLAEEALEKLNRELEERVEKRTTELIKANEQLKEEIAERKRAENRLRSDEVRLEALLRLSQMSETSLAEIADFTLDQGIKLTNSSIGFLGFLSEDEAVYTLQTVSKNVVKECSVVGGPVQWHISGAGMWADAVRQRKTLLVNDYAKPHPSKRGLPEGHAPVKRLMVLPVFEGKKITAVVAVGNKASDYDKADERQLILLIKGMWSYLQQKRVDDALRRANEALSEESRQRRELSGKLIQLLEKERHEIAMELHDQLGQSLVTLKMDLELILGQQKSIDTASKSPIEAAAAKASDCIGDLKSIAHRLRPSTLDKLGLVPSLASLIDNINEHANIDIHFFTRDIPEQFAKEKELALYRICQEALTNVMKYAQATEASVNLIKKDQSIILTVEDNGVGFEDKQETKTSEGDGSLGLHIMKERAVLLNGEFTIDSRVGGGTHLMAEIPI